MRPHFLTTGGLTLIATLAASFAQAADPASAEDLPAGGLGGAYVEEGGDPTAWATSGMATGSGGRRAGGPESCVWVEDEASPLAGITTVYLQDGSVAESPTGRWMHQVCHGKETRGQRPLPEASPTPEVLAEQALQSVSIPEPPIATSPAAQRLVVRLPTWLWVDPAWWKPYSATAAAGPVSATVTAQPARTIWSMGDGTTLTCAGPGTPWAAGMSEDQTDCSHTYTSSSESQPNGRFPVSMTVELDVRWTSNLGASGGLPTISRSTSTSVQVGEIQAIETR